MTTHRDHNTFSGLVNYINGFELLAFSKVKEKGNDIAKLPLPFHIEKMLCLLKMVYSDLDVTAAFYQSLLSHQCSQKFSEQLRLKIKCGLVGKKIADRTLVKLWLICLDQRIAGNQLNQNTGRSPKPIILMYEDPSPSFPHNYLEVSGDLQPPPATTCRFRPQRTHPGTLIASADKGGYIINHGMEIKARSEAEFIVFCRKWGTSSSFSEELWPDAAFKVTCGYDYYSEIKYFSKAWPKADFSMYGFDQRFIRSDLKDFEEKLQDCNSVILVSGLAETVNLLMLANKAVSIGIKPHIVGFAPFDLGPNATRNLTEIRKICTLHLISNEEFTQIANEAESVEGLFSAVNMHFERIVKEVLVQNGSLRRSPRANQP